MLVLVVVGAALELVEVVVGMLDDELGVVLEDVLVVVGVVEVEEVVLDVVLVVVGVVDCAARSEMRGKKRRGSASFVCEE